MFEDGSSARKGQTAIVPIMGGSFHLGDVQGANACSGEAKMPCSGRELGVRVHLVSCPNHVYVHEVRVGLHAVGRKLGMSFTMAHLVFCPTHVVHHAIGVVSSQRRGPVAEPIQVADHVVVVDHLALVVDQLEGEELPREPFFDEGVLWGRSFLSLQGSPVRSSSSSSSICVHFVIGAAPAAGAAGAATTGVLGADGAEGPDGAAGS